MRLSVSVNGKTPTTAELPANGFLGAHINLSATSNSDDPDRVWINAIDTTESLSNTHHSWEAGDLAEGDVIEIRLLPDGPTDSPSHTQVTSDRAENLFSDSELADRLLKLVEPFASSLSTFADEARDIESPEEFRKIALAIGSVWTEIDRSLLLPTYRRHTSLIPEGRKNEFV
jgi:hypothetical protein